MKDYSNITPELLETVERYESGTMAQEERIAFEEQLRSDADFKILVENIRLTLLGIETQALKEQLDEFHKEIPETPQIEKSTTKVRFLSFTKLAIAAGIIIALGMFWMFSGSSNDKLFNQHFKADPGLPTTMSSTDSFVFYDAMVNYKQGDYKTAISKWQQLAVKTPENDTINYFLGVAYLADKNAKKAIPFLNKTLDRSESVFLEDAHYYLGMAYLKSDRTEEAIQEFKKSGSEKSNAILKHLK
ncbi:tetratricopeptide repeat protein [Gelidibacter maritimus]|uniref:Tetratricopeptide repeat protein n=1 Tax=Gelidibacter maritimus TaxID=2761487 RepID=A0A7W2M3K5_9FLAO|nr:tetratricopeptide repeat protein [Gelidibacter maritimus]MBA6152060.1 tetratricopeptide repeat protein [Gelidibacter maritimus]